jgi:hypothetical protein
MTRPRGDMGKAKLLQKRSDIALVKVDAEPLGDDALQIHPPPSRDAVGFPIRTPLNDLGQLGHLLRRQTRRRAA